MLLSNQPTPVQLPFANSGTKNTIPVASQIGITAGAASYTDGFPPLTFTPIASGGVPPSGADFNGIFNAITSVLRWQSGGGQFTYSSTWSSANGGYAKGALLLKADGSGFWFNQVDSNTVNPDTVGTNWTSLEKLLSSSIQGTFKNLSMSATGSNAVVSVTADALTLSNASGSYKAVTGVNLSINLSNTVGQPLAISTGAWSSNTWYAIYVWNNGTTTTATADPSGTSPTAPAGYSGGTWMRVGWIRTDGTGNKYPLSFKQFGRKVRYSVAGNVSGLPVVSSGVQGNITTPTWVAVSLANYVPSTASSALLVIMGYGGGAGTVMAAPSNSYGAYSSTTNPPPVVSSVGSTARVVIPYDMLLESTSIYTASDQAATGIACGGWEDNL